MNGGQACRTSGATRSGSFHADVRGLCSGLRAPSEPPPSSGRSEANTQPYTDAYADTLASPTSFESDSPNWCVDVGHELATMTTFELWEALERGQVLAWMRVWREGMECWTPVGEIVEFAWALAGTPTPPMEPAPLPESDPPSEARTGPPAPTVTPDAPEAPAPPAQSAIRPITRPVRGARWIALGSAVALAAVASAIFVRKESPPPPPVASAGAALVVEPAALVPVEPLLFEAPHHDERGQRRLPRGGRRVSYGR